MPLQLLIFISAADFYATFHRFYILSIVLLHVNIIVCVLFWA
nr:MAG TPA: hypothetical protein [Caudoviricetes sp.]